MAGTAIASRPFGRVFARRALTEDSAPDTCVPGTSGERLIGIGTQILQLLSSSISFEVGGGIGPINRSLLVYRDGRHFAPSAWFSLITFCIVYAAYVAECPRYCELFLQSFDF